MQRPSTNLTLNPYKCAQPKGCYSDTVLDFSQEIRAIMKPLTSKQGILIIIHKYMEQERISQTEATAELTQTATIDSVSTPAATEIKYAGFWIRLVAILIDSVIIGFVARTLGLLLGFEEESLRSFEQLCFFAYFIFMTFNYQATLGKQALGIMVVSEDSRPLVFQQVVMREFIGRLINFLTLGLSYALVGVNSKKQGLHDKIAHTQVVYGKK